MSLSFLICIFNITTDFYPSPGSGASFLTCFVFAYTFVWLWLNWLFEMFCRYFSVYQVSSVFSPLRDQHQRNILVFSELAKQRTTVFKEICKRTCSSMKTTVAIKLKICCWICSKFCFLRMLWYLIRCTWYVKQCHYLYGRYAWLLNAYKLQDIIM